MAAAIAASSRGGAVLGLEPFSQPSMIGSNCPESPESGGARSPDGVEG